MDINLLRNYKLQNPVKYAQKFGDKTPEEINLPIAPPTVVNGVTLEMSEKKEKEMEFTEPVPVPVEEKPKRIKKLKNNNV